MNTKIIKLDINKRLYEKITAKQGDTKSRYLLFHLLDGAVPFSLTNMSVRVYGLKPDNKEIFNDLQIVDANKGYCKLELTSQALAVPGNLDLELVIMEGESKLSTMPFTVDVIKSKNSAAAIESSNEYKALDRSLTKVEEWNNEFADKSGKLEELYTPRLNGLSSQMADIAINVKSFGAIGNGVIDDTIAIQNAFDSLKNKGGKILIPEGIYKITKQLKIYSNTHVNISPDATLVNYILDGSTSVLSNFHIEDIVRGYDGEHDIYITGGGKIICIPDPSFIPIYRTKGEWGNQGMSFAHGKKITVDNITIQDVYRAHAIEITGCKGVIVKNCLFDGWELDERYDNPPIREAVQVETAYAGTSTSQILDDTESEDVEIYDNDCSIVNSSYKAYGSAFGSHTRVGKVKNIKINNNRINGCLSAAVSTGNLDGVEIKSNIINNCKTAISSSDGLPVSNAIISDNTIINCKDKAIRIDKTSNNITIKHNDISEIDDVGLYVDENTDNIKVYLNTLLNCNKLLKDDCYARIYGGKNKYVFDNIFDQTNSVVQSSGLRFAETVDFQHINTTQYNNKVLFQCSSVDVTLTPSIIDNSEVWMNTDLIIADGSTFTSKINPLKYKNLVLTLNMSGTKKITIPTSLIGNEVNTLHISASDNVIVLLKFTVTLLNGTIRINNPRRTTINNGTETTENVTSATNYKITKIQGVY